MSKKKIGLISGGGDLPIIFTNIVKNKGINVITVALNGMASPEIEKVSDKTYWVSIGEPEKVINIFKSEGVRDLVMLGWVKKTHLYKDIIKDKLAEEVLKTSRDKRDETLLKSAANKLWWLGLYLKKPTDYLKELIPEKGVLTKRIPSKEELSDIKFGYKIAKKVAGLDIGQTIVVKNKSIVTVEGVEGTDETIKRGGSLCGPGAVIIKVARPKQDMRFDVPLVGIKTIESLIQAKASVLALERKKTYLIDKEALIKLADQNNISVIII